MKRSTAQKLGQPILGKFVAASVVGVKPLLMGVGPWKAIPKVFELTGLTKDDVDIFEINEAFASQCLWCANELGLPMEKINPKGGAIGHIPIAEAQKPQREVRSPDGSSTRTR